MKNINTKSGAVKIADFEEICANAEVVLYTEKSIEVPGIVSFYLEGSIGSFTKMIYVADKIIEISKENFDKMLAAVKASAKEPNILASKTKTKPEKQVLFNLAKIKEDFIYGEETDDTLLVNNNVFTNSTMEYHGEALFSTKHVFFLDYAEMAKIREAIFQGDDQE